MTRKEWKVEVHWYYTTMKRWQDSPYRREREYANYVKRFLFGSGEVDWFTNETWKRRADERSLPMPPNVYMFM